MDAYGPGHGTGGRFSGARGRWGTTETKPFYKTSEFWTLVVLGLFLLIAGNTVEGKDGGADYFRADKVWLYLVILASAYIVSRGIAKAGVREWDEDGTGGHSEGMPLGERVKTAAKVLAEGETPGTEDTHRKSSPTAPTNRL